jgi:nucleoside-diphosphate-sugar epimerase
MKTIITGAGGFVGRNLLKGLPRRGEILALDRAEGLEEFVSRHGLDHVQVRRGDMGEAGWLRQVASEWGEEANAVVYLAGNGDPAWSVAHPAEDLRDGALALVTFFSTFRAGRVVYFSSGAVYDGLNGPVSPASRLDPMLPYAVGKLASEQYVKFFGKRGQIGEWVILRFFGAYGPFEPPRKIFTRLARAFALEQRQDYIIRGDGRNLIDAMFIDDTVRAVAAVLEGGSSNLVADFCVGRPYTVRELVEEAARIFNVEALITMEGKVPEYIEFRPSPTAMKDIFGFTPAIPLKEGMKILAQHLKNENKGKV